MRRVEPSCEGPDRVWFDMFRDMPSASWSRSMLDSDGGLLAAMKEPSLWCGPAPDSFRFLWVHSFSSMTKYPPTAVRVSRDGDGWYVRAVQLTSAEERQIATDRQLRLSREQTAQVLGAIARFDLWGRTDYDSTDTFDGATWLVEGRRGTGYRPVMLVNAGQEAVERAAGVLLDIVDIDPAVFREGIDPERARRPRVVPPSP